MESDFGTKQEKELFIKAIKDCKRITKSPGSTETKGGRVIHIVEKMLIDVTPLLFTEEGKYKVIKATDFNTWYKLGKMFITYIKEIVKILTGSEKDIHYTSPNY